MLGPLRLIAQDPSTGPIPVAAAQAAEGSIGCPALSRQVRCPA
ncbi:DUF6245 family protein [Nonomuraea sp. NPDC050022]